MLSSLFTNTRGHSFYIIVPSKENGATANEVPTINTKSAFFMISGPSKNYFGSCYPKKMMSGLTRPWQWEHFIGYIFYTYSFHFSMGAYFLQRCLIQRADRPCPWAWISLVGLIPALVYKSSMFWVRFFNRTPSSSNFLMNLCPKVGWYSPDKYYFATLMNGKGFLT